jgi:hypothetical protein
VYERELIGLVQAVRHWHPYLWERAFLIRTDHFNLKYVLHQCFSTILQHQWASKLVGIDFRVEFHPGAHNVVTDALSHRDTEEAAEMLALSAPSFQIFDDIRQELDSDQNLRTLKHVGEGTKGEQCVGTNYYQLAPNPHDLLALNLITLQTGGFLVMTYRR